MDFKDLREKVYLKILEDCDDPGLVTNHTLVQACMLFHEYSFDAESSKSIKEVYNEVIKRAHTLTEDQISQIDQSFNRL